MSARPLLESDPGVKDVALVPAQDESGLAHVIQKLAENPNVDVDKLERIIVLQERLMRHAAKAAFDDAFAEMQSHLPVIIERGKTNNGTYAPLEDIVEVVRPILFKFRFSLKHKTEWPDAKTVLVKGVLSRGGHSETSEFLSSADSSGNKNTIQGLASAISYGKRYTTKDLLLIVERGEDDDARRAEAKPIEEPPGFSDWFDDLTAVADDGLKALEAVWAKSKPEYKAHLTKTNRTGWNALKARAGKVVV